MRKFLSLLIVTAMVATLAIGTTSVEAKAEDTEECIDGSYLTDGESSEVTVESLTRGIYLKSGTSKLSKLGTGKIAAGGNTVGQTTVTKIAVSVRVQRLVNGSWTYYTSWTASKTSSAYVSTSKTLTVPTGYYYRVYSTHNAVTDSSDSYTNGLYI